MAKKGRDAEKKAALAAKKEAKQEKAARKRLNKESRGDAGGDNSDSENNSEASSDHDIDRLVRQYKQQDIVTTQDGLCKVVPCDSFPLARANATFTVTDDTKKKDAYLFGGEYHDGTHTVVSDQLFRYELGTGKWKQLVCASAPPPRCAHSAIYYNRSLYVFGGELASATEYHHYKDVWKFDTVKLQWNEIRATTGTLPSARSGAAVTVWKHFLVIFGGFYEAESQTPRWYNDVTVLNLQTEQWLDIPHSKLSVRPEPRSACNTALIGEDKWLIHGGFSKLPTSKLKQHDDSDAAVPASETIVHTDAWILHLKPLLSGKPPTWERWTSSLSRSKRMESAQISPNGRSGVGSVSYNNNVLLFAGVVDQELHHHKLESVFYNDLFIFHVEKRKFIPIRIASNTTTTTKETKEGEENESDDDGVAEDLVQEQEDADKTAAGVSGWDLDKLRSNMFAFVDGDGNVVYERIGTVMKRRGKEGESKADESDEEKEEEKQDKAPPKKSKRRQEPPPDIIIERTEPLPRIKSCLFLNGNTLYVYGGLLEVGDREVTLDDMWCIDLRKGRTWKCIFPGTMHKQVWLGAIHDDDDSYYSSNADAGGHADGELTDSDNELDEEGEAKETETTNKSSSENPKQEIAELVDKYQLEDANRTPQPGEGLAEFYARTSDYWNENVAAQGDAESDGMSSKELKRGGFALARTRFEELEPIIVRLMELKMQRKMEKERNRKGDKKENNSKSKKLAVRDC